MAEALPQEGMSERLRDCDLGDLTATGANQGVVLTWHIVAMVLLLLFVVMITYDYFFKPTPPNTFSYKPLHLPPSPKRKTR